MCAFETPRLLLKPLQLSDADAGQRLFPHWEIVRHLARGIPWPMPADGVLTYYRDVALPAVERGEAWHWSIRLKGGPDHMIGSIALFKGEVNRGFWMGLPWQGKGLMSEAVIPVTDYWFDVLGFDVMRIPKAIDNIASRRISEKTGMRVVETKDGEYVSGTLPTEIWEITAEEWRSSRGY
jgi:RimJ/RimL family protein N-acetyltransferase